MKIKIKIKIKNKIKIKTKWDIGYWIVGRCEGVRWPSVAQSR